MAKTDEQISFLCQVLQQLWWYKLLIDNDYYDCNNSSNHAVVSTSINIQCLNMKICLNIIFADNKREMHAATYFFYRIPQPCRKHTKILEAHTSALPNRCIQQRFNQSAVNVCW